jgi:1-acyl-sn-glycerol-3-phosphate acyltransferase
VIAAIKRLFQPVVYWGVALSARYYGRLFWRVRVRGRENIPKSGPLLVAVTHESVLDPVIVGSELSRQLRFLARNTLFGPRGQIKLHGRVLQYVGAVPIEREGGGARDALRAARTCLQAGEAVLIFPEGTRSPDGTVQRFRRGVGMIARSSGCPVLPVSIDGSHRLWRKGSKLPRLWGGPVHLRYGKPVTYDKTTSAEDVAAQLRGVILDLRGVRGEPAGDGAGLAVPAGDGASQGSAAGS